MSDIPLVACAFCAKSPAECFACRDDLNACACADAGHPNRDRDKDAPTDELLASFASFDLEAEPRDEIENGWEWELDAVSRLVPECARPFEEVR